MGQPEDGSVWPTPRAGSFVGRAAPLALLRRCLDTALSGVPCAVLVEGVAGIGKSRLVAEILPTARRRGAMVLVGRCSEGLSVPYLPLASALEPLGDDLGAAVELISRTSRPPDDPLSASTERPAAPIVAACRAAVRAARRRPVVLLIEDLHWADRPTAELFEQIVATALDAGLEAPTAILVAGTLRPPTGHVAGVVERMRREPSVRSVHLAGMDELELNELLTSLGPARPSRALLSAVATATTGNPLLVRTLLARLTETGGVEVRDGELRSTVGEVLIVRGGLDEELRRRLDRVGRPCRDLLTRAAFLGDGGFLADLEAVASSPAGGFDELLEEAEAVGLLHDDGERYRFDHAQLRQLLYHEPEGRRRQRLHRELADHLEVRHGDDGRWAIAIADHLRQGGQAVDAARLARFSLTAGEQAWALGAWGAAARHFDTVLDSRPPDDARERARLALRAGICHFRDHDLRAAEQRLHDAVAGAKAEGDVDVWTVAVQMVIRARLTIGPTSVGAGIDTSLLEEALAATGSDDRRRGEIVGLLAEARFHAFDAEGGMALLDEARQLAERSGDDALATNLELAAGLQHMGRLELDAASAAFRSSARHARLLADPWQRDWGLGRLPLVEICAGDLDAASAHADEAAAIAAANHDWAEHALASACTTQVAVARAQFAVAETAGALSLQMYRRSDYAFVPPLLYPAWAAARALRGDDGGADEALDDWVAVGGRGLVPHRLLVLASSLDRGAMAGARPFRPMGNRPVNLFTLPILCAQAEVAVVLGDAALLTDVHAPLSRVHRDGVRWCVGWPLLVSRLLAGVARSLGRYDEAERWCAVAAEEAAAASAAGEFARVTVERALLAAEAGDNDTARALAGEATVAFDQIGMLPLARFAHRISGVPAAGERVLRTILFTDLVGSTAMNVRQGDDAYLALLAQHNAILRSRLRQFDGVELKHTGDGIASWFASAKAACECALATRDDLAEHNASHPDTPFFVRFGLASGSPIAHEGDLFGVSVSLAARLCAHAAAGQVLVADDVARAARGERLSFRALEPMALRGFPEPVAVFAVGPGSP